MAHVEQLVGSYRAWASNGASRAPAWLHDLREVGIARFHDLGFPNMKQEAWRFTSVAPIAEGSFELAKPPARILRLEDIRPFLLLASRTKSRRMSCVGVARGQYRTLSTS